MNHIARTFKDHLVFRQDRNVRTYGIFQHYTDAQKASVEEFIGGLYGSAMNNPLKRKMYRLILNRGIVLTRGERNELCTLMMNIQDPDIFEAIRKMLVHNYTHWSKTNGDWRRTEYDFWRTGKIVKKYFNTRIIHTARNPRKAKNKQNYHTDIGCCRRRIKVVERELRNIQIETDGIMEERKQLETHLYNLRKTFQENLINLIENEGIEVMEDIGTRSYPIISKIQWCDDKLNRSLKLSKDISDELIVLRQIEWELTIH